ncbi:hypothetical protein N7520_000173 [Penicillium odoratum]|uniref:uncharacterized protein n=1 Tax=Penicillium odoratum TaxID=1167516 RepID=UPI00254993F8|nr:uncharacterized protein N7520_000173 [Penicillium odoratum]KAJ5776927.1 hypothetical protein N7520_000173 [Penicillium odoratum]
MAQPYDSYDPLTHIPPFVKPLAPYIKTQQEALRIRQALTSYLRSLIVFKDDTSHTSHLALCAPTDAVVDVKRAPVDLSGLRKDYLKALQANVAARKDLRAVSEEVALLRRQRASCIRPIDPDPQEPGADLRDYVSLLRDQRRYAKLQVFQHYLEDFKAKEPTGLDSSEDSAQVSLPEGLETDVPERKDPDTDLEGLVHKLERAVVRAQTQLDREKRLFEKIKTQHDARGKASDSVPSAVKAQALQRTRDELVQWVEERLVSEVDPDESMVDLQPEDIEEAQRLLEQHKMQIKEQYAAYLQARRELLDAASKACQPVTVTPKPPSRTTYRADILEEIPAPSSLDVLSYATETLVPLSKAQKSLALQRSYLSGLLAKEKSTALRALHRIRDESHLLPEYPILARQPRFKHAVAALNSHQSQSPQRQSDEVVSLAEAWAFASEAAAANESEFVQQKVALGTEVAQDARQTLDEVYGALNQAGVTQADPEPSDIWAEQTRVGHSGSREKRPQGPWSRLHGRVGLE